MTGLNSTPSDDPKLIRALVARLEALERPKTILIGSWCISESQYGDLVADHMPTGTRRVIGLIDERPRNIDQH